MNSICEKWCFSEWDNILEELIIMNYLGKCGWDDTNSKGQFAKETSEILFISLRGSELN